MKEENLARVPSRILQLSLLLHELLLQGLIFDVADPVRVDLKLKASQSIAEECVCGIDVLLEGVELVLI